MENETILKQIEAGQVPPTQTVPHFQPVPCQEQVDNIDGSPSALQLQATAPPQSIVPLHPQGMPLYTQQVMPPLHTQQVMPPSQTQAVVPLQTQAVPPLQTQAVPLLQTQAVPPSQIQTMPCEQPLLAQSNDGTGVPLRRYESGLSKCLRGIIYFYNICLFILGSAAIGTGIWLLLGDIKVQYLTVFVGQYQYLPLATYLLTAGGSIAIFVALLGIFAIHQLNKYALGIYGVMMFIMLMAFGISSQMSILSKEMMTGGIRDNMRETLTSSYGIDTTTNEKNRQITESWDYVQRKFECCGVSGDVNSTDSWALYMTVSLWYNQIMQSGTHMQKVPYSCCKGSNKAICTGQEYWPGPPNHLNPRKEKHKKENAFLHTTGCYDQLVHFLMTYSNVVPKLSGFASALYSLFGITSFIVAICLMIFTKQKIETRLR